MADSGANFTTTPPAGPLGLPPTSNPYPVAPAGYFFGCLLAVSIAIAPGPSFIRASHRAI
jgi:hypothetical protein